MAVLARVNLNRPARARLVKRCLPETTHQREPVISVRDQVCPLREAAMNAAHRHAQSMIVAWVY